MATLKPVSIVCDDCGTEVAVALHSQLREGPDPLHMYAQITPDLEAAKAHVCPAEETR